MISNIADSLRDGEVWIVGSDPTLDGYPDDFLSDKIAITLHLAYLKFPLATYTYLSEYDRAQYLLEASKEYHTAQILSSLPHYGKSTKETINILKDCTSVVFHKKRNYLPTGIRGEVRQGYTTWKVKRTIERKSTVWGGHGSCLHTCIYAALFLGAKKIHVIGAGHSLVPGTSQDHFKAADDIHQNMRVGDTFFDAKIVYPVIMQTIALKEACEANGIPFYWHARYTPTMDSYVTVSDDKLEELRRNSRRSIPIVKKLYRFLWKRPITYLFHSWR